MSLHRATFVASLLSCALTGCGGGGGGGGPPPVSPTLSTVVVSVPFGTPADGVSTVTVTATIVDKNGNPQTGVPVELRASGSGGLFVQPPVTDANGVAQGTIASLVAERKDVFAAAFPGPKETLIGPASVEFVRFLPNTYFVRTSGSDGNAGTAPLQAWRTLPFALSQIGAGDTLYVGAGTYDPIVVSIAASSESPLVLRGDPSGLYTGDAGDVIVDAGGTGYGVRFSAAQWVTLRGFTLRGAAASGGPGAGVWFDTPQSQHCSVIECSLFENVLGIDVKSALAVDLEANGISNNFGSGIRLESAPGALIASNLVYNNSGRGLSLEGTSLGLSVRLNTFYGNVLNQVHENGAGSTGSFHENVLSQGLAGGIEIATSSGLMLASNLAWANAAANYQMNGAALPPSNVVADPALVDPDGADGVLGGTGRADDDFHVQGGSPALDAGGSDARDVWLATGAAAAQATRFDQEFDGQGTDGDPINLGFHYQVAVDGLDALPAEGGRAVWARTDDVVVRARGWTRSTSAWGAEQQAVATNREARWLVHRLARTVQPDELLSELVETTSGKQLFVRHWDGRKWTETSVAPFSDEVQSATERGFDVEFERPSGDGIVAWSNGTSIPKFRVLSNGLWSEEEPVYANPPGAGAIRWVELVPAFQGERMALVTLDDALDLVATVWDGSAWGTPTLLEANTIAVDDYRPFDAAFEALSGDLLVMWGYSVFFEQARFATLASGSTTWVAGLHPSTEAVGSQIQIASDPTSNRMAASFGEAPFDDDVSFSIWDGALWTHTREVTLNGVPNQRSIKVGWVGNTGRAFGVWRDSTLTANLNFAVWDGLWKVKPQVSLPGVGDVVQIEGLPVPGQNRSLFLLLDDTGSLFGAAFDGSRWTVQNGGQPLGVGLDATSGGQRFSLDLRP